MTTLKTFANAAAQTWILSAAILFSAAVPNIAQAKDSTAAATMACAKELKAQCNGVRVEGTTCSNVSRRAKRSFPQDASLWQTMLCVGATGMQPNFAKAMLPALVVLLIV
jgi:hypothetical protein